VDGTADQKVLRRHSPNDLWRHRIATQMHAICSARQRDVDAIVHDDSRTRFTRPGDDGRGEIGEIACVEIAFTHDDTVESRRDCSFNLAQQTLPGRLERHVAGETTTIRDEKQLHSRAVNTKASSEKPASRLSTPSPLMAPRTKLFLIRGRSVGQTSAK